MSTTWDPAAYLAFHDHRARPFHDLLARVTAVAPRRRCAHGPGAHCRDAVQMSRDVHGPPVMCTAVSPP